MALAGVLYQTLVSPAPDGVSPALVRTIGIGFGAASLAFIGLGVLAIRAGRHSDLDERRRRIRAWVAPAVSGIPGCCRGGAGVGDAGRTVDTQAARTSEPRDHQRAGDPGARELRQNSRPQLARFHRPANTGRGCAHSSRAQRPRSTRPSAPAGEALCTRGLDHRGTGGASRHAGARPAPGDQPRPRVPKLQRLPRTHIDFGKRAPVSATRLPAASPCSRSRWTLATDRSGRSTGHSGNASE